MRLEAVTGSISSFYTSNVIAVQQSLSSGSLVTVSCMLADSATLTIAGFYKTKKPRAGSALHMTRMGKLAAESTTRGEERSALFVARMLN